jgi:hypothetical protein
MNPGATLDLIEAEFLAAGAGGPDTLRRTASGVRALIALANHLNGRPAELDGAARRLSSTIARATETIVLAIPQVAPERAYFALGGASALAWRLALAPADGVGGDRVLSFDALDHLILFADEASALHRRRQIEARGNRFERFVAIAKAAAASADGAGLN